MSRMRAIARARRRGGPRVGDRPGAIRGQKFTPRTLSCPSLFLARSVPFSGPTWPDTHGVACARVSGRSLRHTFTRHHGRDASPHRRPHRLFDSGMHISPQARPSRLNRCKYMRRRAEKQPSKERAARPRPLRDPQNGSSQSKDPHGTLLHLPSELHGLLVLVPAISLAWALAVVLAIEVDAHVPLEGA